jgi:hypothetical protein
MIRKFAKVPECRIALGLMLAAILAGATALHAQTPAQTAPAAPAPAQPPAAQTPADQSTSGQAPSAQSSSQEASPEEVGSLRKVKPKEYKNFSFNAGGGGSLTNGATAKFARAGAIGAAGVARNYSKYFGLRVDFQWDNLPLRNSALQLAQAPGATSHVYSFTFDPIINIPVNPKWGGYLVFGPAFYHRSGKLDSSRAQPGSACNAFWNWWGTCLAGSLPINKQFLSIGQNEVGENFGGGITRRLTPKFELYGEFRYLHGTGGGRTTDLRPITVGLRW